MAGGLAHTSVGVEIDVTDWFIETQLSACQISTVRVNVVDKQGVGDVKSVISVVQAVSRASWIQPCVVMLR